MAKKNDKPQVINNIQELNLEVDYDKLAEAIVKAQNALTIQENDCEDEESFLDKAIDGKIPKGKFFSQTLSKIMQGFFYVLAVVSVLFVLYFGWMVIYYLHAVSWDGFENISENIFFIALLGLLIIFDVVFVFFTVKIANEIGEEQDKNYIISAFSSVVSLVALIVALVALFKGVG